eukprot:6180706-Pleurochrysis_carterae.AAC.8
MSSQLLAESSHMRRSGGWLATACTEEKERLSSPGVQDSTAVVSPCDPAGVRGVRTVLAECAQALTSVASAAGPSAEEPAEDWHEQGRE